MDKICTHKINNCFVKCVGGVAWVCEKESVGFYTLNSTNVCTL